MLGRSKQRCETGGGAESGKAEPVDRAVSTNQCGRQTVADESVIFDSRRHLKHPNGPAPSKTRAYFNVPTVRNQKAWFDVNGADW